MTRTGHSRPAAQYHAGPSLRRAWQSACQGGNLAADLLSIGVLELLKDAQGLLPRLAGCRLGEAAVGVRGGGGWVRRSTTQPRTKVRAFRAAVSGHHPDLRAMQEAIALLKPALTLGPEGCCCVAWLSGLQSGARCSALAR
jgi:hypothetical protein